MSDKPLEVLIAKRIALRLDSRKRFVQSPEFIDWADEILGHELKPLADVVRAAEEWQLADTELDGGPCSSCHHSDCDARRGLEIALTALRGEMEKP